MFKLAKIENGHSSVPEILKMRKSTLYRVMAGTPLVMVNGEIVPADATSVMRYMAVSDAAREDKYVFCYKIYPNMLFEADCEKSPNYYTGKNVSYISSENEEFVIGIQAVAGGTVEVVDAGDVERAQKIIVKFLDKEIM